MLSMEQSKPQELGFAGSVPAAMRPVVESLFFFNPQQGAIISEIRQTIEKTGSPFIFEWNNRIRIDVPSGSTQCLFACSRRDRPVGVALYSRPAWAVIWISHLAIDPSCTDAGDECSIGIAGALVNKIREVARSIKGAARIQLPYRRASFLRVAG